MYYKIVVILLGMLAISTQVHANPYPVDLDLSTTYVPMGFDDNDRGEFAIQGNMKNTCYRIGAYSTKVDEANKIIQVHQQGYYYPGITCLAFDLPFTKIVNVGILSRGNYQIVDFISKKEIGRLEIKAASQTTPDDFLYAPVMDAYIVTQKEGPKHTLVLKGNFTDRCSVFDDVKVNYNGRVIVIQPTMKHVGERCDQAKVRFLKTIELKADLQGEYLLHVRSLNGASISKMVDLE